MEVDYTTPYQSVRWPVCANNMVATSQPLATAAGINAMRRGGNAVDAALAAAIALTVVEPTSNGIGSDAFSLLHIDGTLYGLNSSGRSPQGWTPQRFAGLEHMPTTGWDAITVPGAVAAWVEISQRFGRLAFDALFEDAIRYAHDGYAVGPVTAMVWQASESRFTNCADFVAHFCPPPQPGQQFASKDMAKTLTEIATTQGESFYRGRLAEHIIACSDAADGTMTLADLAEHAADWVAPIQIDYRGRTVHEIPPNGQGLATLIALGILENFDLQLDSAAGYHIQIEAMKIAVRAAFDHIGDPQSMTRSVDELLDKRSLTKVASEIGDTASALPPAALPASHDTVYLCTADDSGNMVSFIQSNYMGFGSGVVVPGTGISMQNRGHGFTLQPGHPNQVGPGKRPYHTIIPGFVTDNGHPLLAYGVMGGHMQHQGHVQMVERIFDHGQNPQAASDAPRWMVNPDFSVSVEAATPEAIVNDLQRRGHDVSVVPNPWLFGGAQLILSTAAGYVAGSDHRKEGQAAGF